MKNKFWNEASYGGAVLGLASVAFTVLSMFLPQGANFVVSVVSFVVTLYLLFFFTKRRADEFIKEGYTYAQCLGFIVAMGIFAGIITGAYQIVASNFLFAEKYEETYAMMIKTYAQVDTFKDSMDFLKTTIRAYIFSPMPVLIVNIMASVFTYAFYGLFISLGTKREAEIFDIPTLDEEDEE